MNTYSFTQAGYVTTLPSTATGPGTLSGTFTGTLNALGRFQASDLSAFSLTYSFPTQSGTVSGPVGGLGDLSLFSFNTDSGNDLLVVAEDPFRQGTCVGAAATLSPFCNPGGNNPAETLGVALLANVVIARTTQPPVVTLVASVITPNAVPEPATWWLLVGGFGLLGFAVRRSSGARLAAGR